MTTTSELNALDHSIYSAIKRIRGQNKPADLNSVHKEIIKTIDFEKIGKNFLDDRINMLIQTDKTVNRLNRNKDSFRTVGNDFNSYITDAHPMTQKSPSFLSTPSFPASRDQSHSELHGKMTGIIRDQIKLQHSNQESTENTCSLSKRN